MNQTELIVAVAERAGLTKADAGKAVEALVGTITEGIVKLLGGSRGLDELAHEQGCCGLCGLRDAADVVPRLEGAGPLGTVVGCGHAVAGQKEEVVDLIVGGQEALSGHCQLGTVCGSFA